MSEWKECTIADLGEVVGGATPSTKKPENYKNGDISWITPKDLSTFNGRFILHGERNITETGLNSCSTRLLPTNTVLFSSRAPIGYVAIAAKEMCTNQGFKSIIPNSDTDYMFLYYLLKFNRNNIENMGSGTTFKEVSGNTMKSIKVCVPIDIEEQRKIGAVLSAIDDKIELNTAINENLEQQTYLLLEQMLSTPHDDVCCLSDIANINPRYTLSKGTEARYIDMSQLSTTTSFPDGWTFRAYNGGMKFRNQDTIMARITPCLENGKTAYIDFLADNEIAFGSTEYIVLSPKENIPPELLYCIVRHPNFRSYATVNMNGSSGRQRVSGEIIGKYEMPQFTEDELAYFRSVTRPLFKQITENSLQNRNLSALRDTLLPKLMNGEIDVSEVKF